MSLKKEKKKKKDLLNSGLCHSSRTESKKNQRKMKRELKKLW